MRISHKVQTLALLVAGTIGAAAFGAESAAGWLAAATLFYLLFANR